MGEEFPIKSEAVSLKKVLDGKYHIPAYQRPYEWGEKHIDDFLLSIFEGFKTKKEQQLDTKPIFFGTIQLNKENEQYDIVDGQQRIITFLLLLTVLEYYTKETGNNSNVIVAKSDELKNALDSKLVDVQPNKASKYDKNKVLLDKKLKEYYKEINHKYSSSEEFYSALINFIKSNVYFVRLETEKMELSDVISVFNTINTTGLALNASDVFKFRYHDFLTREYKSTEHNWIEKIDQCYKYIELDNEKYRGNSYRSMIDMSWVLDVYKHIICSKFDWGFSEVSKSNQKFYDDLFKERKYESIEDVNVLKFESFKNLVEEFVKYWRWIEDERQTNTPKVYLKELFSPFMVGKSRYSRYWTIPFMVAYFRAEGRGWQKYYIDALRVNLNMFKFFAIYSVINDKVINAVQNKICKDCFRWFKECSIQTINNNIKNMLWSEIRGYGEPPYVAFYNKIKNNLFENGSRAHLICTLSALLDEIKNIEDNACIDNSSGNIIQDKLFNWGKNPYDIEHIFAQKNFENYSNDDKKIFNGIGNLIVLDRKINRKIQKIQVRQKAKEYKNSIYISVKMLAAEIEENDREWDKGVIAARQQREIEKIEGFMEE